MHFLVVFRLDGCCSQYLLLMIVDIDLDLWKYIDRYGKRALAWAGQLEFWTLSGLKFWLMIFHLYKYDVLKP